jgi:hypothetical protein
MMRRENIAITFWDTKEDAQAATEDIFPIMQKELGNLANEAKEEVLEVAEFLL